MIDFHLLVVCILTFVIHLIGSLSYSSRIAGVRMRKIALSFSLFNILMLVSRLSNTFQAPLLAKRIEENIHRGFSAIPSYDFRIILISASAASLLGALLIPTFQRIFSSALERFSVDRSIPKLLLHSFSKSGIRQFKSLITIPAMPNLQQLHWPKGFIPVLIIHVIGTAIWTVGVLSALYAGYLAPELRTTSGMLSGAINGMATLLMFIIVDPFLSLLTDDAIDGKLSDAVFRKSIIFLAGSRLLGTILAQFLLVPGAYLILAISRML